MTGTSRFDRSLCERSCSHEPSVLKRETCPFNPPWCPPFPPREFRGDKFVGRTQETLLRFSRSTAANFFPLFVEEFVGVSECVRRTTSVRGCENGARGRDTRNAKAITTHARGLMKSVKRCKRRLIIAAGFPTGEKCT